MEKKKFLVTMAHNSIKSPLTGKNVIGKRFTVIAESIAIATGKAKNEIKTKYGYSVSIGYSKIKVEKLA